MPKNICHLPAETGLCRGYFPQYYYDDKEQECKKFIYGGCGGNRNRFWNEEDCKKACRPMNGEFLICFSAYG